MTADGYKMSCGGDEITLKLVISYGLIQVFNYDIRGFFLQFFALPIMVLASFLGCGGRSIGCSDTL